MKIRNIWRGVAAWAVACLMCAQAASGQRKNVHCLADKDNDLVRLLVAEGYDVIPGGDVDEVLGAAPERGAVLLSGGDSVLRLSRKHLALIRDKKLRVFADFASLADTLPQIHDIDFERVVVTDSLAPGLEAMRLLSANRGRYVCARAEKPLMVLARVAGFDKAEYGLEGTEAFPLVYRPAENLWVSTARLSDFARLRLIPEHRWKVFWECVMSDLTEDDVRFSRWPSDVHPAYGRDDALPDSARLASVRKGVEWFFNGHFLIDKSWKADWLDRYEGDGLSPVGPCLPDSLCNGDGTLGVLEGHCSAIDGDGRQKYRYWMRDDVQGEASMTFAITGLLLGNDRYKEIAANLTDFSFDHFRQGPRNDPSGPTYGLLSWAETHDHVYYGDDNARSILGSLLAANVLGEDRWNRRLVEAILANFRTTGKNGFRGERLEEADIQRNGLKFYQERDLVNPHPHFESWMWACYLWLYRQTGWQPLYDMAERGISLTMKAYPDGWGWTNGIQQEKARMLLPLAWLYRVSPTDEHRQWLDTMAREFLKNQVECGAVREELGDASKGMFGRLKTNAEYGTAESPLIFDNGDPIADMLYTCNFAFFGLNEAAHATGDAEFAGAAGRLSDFLTRIQVRSDKVRNVDGAWFRAFNYRNWDYWASDADSGWGSLSTLTGWIQSWIVTTQALMELNTSYWNLTAGSSVGPAETDIFKSMLE